VGVLSMRSPRIATRAVVGDGHGGLHGAAAVPRWRLPRAEGGGEAVGTQRTNTESRAACPPRLSSYVSECWAMSGWRPAYPRHSTRGRRRSRYCTELMPHIAPLFMPEASALAWPGAHHIPASHIFPHESRTLQRQLLCVLVPATWPSAHGANLDHCPPRVPGRICTVAPKKPRKSVEVVLEAWPGRPRQRSPGDRRCGVPGSTPEIVHDPIAPTETRASGGSRRYSGP